MGAARTGLPPHAASGMSSESPSNSTTQCQLIMYHCMYQCTASGAFHSLPSTVMPIFRIHPTTCELRLRT